MLAFEDNVIQNTPQDASNLNDRNLKTGIYYATGSAIGMPMATAGFLLVLKRDNTNITQIFFRYRDCQIWERHYNTVSSTGWKAWKQLH